MKMSGYNYKKILGEFRLLPLYECMQNAAETVFHSFLLVKYINNTCVKHYN